jgi:hypothetical protein
MSVSDSPRSSRLRVRGPFQPEAAPGPADGSNSDSLAQRRVQWCLPSATLTGSTCYPQAQAGPGRQEAIITNRDSLPVNLKASNSESHANKQAWDQLDSEGRVSLRYRCPAAGVPPPAAQAKEGEACEDLKGTMTG